jgi:hypothetical protein
VSTGRDDDALSWDGDDDPTLDVGADAAPRRATPHPAPSAPRKNPAAPAQSSAPVDADDEAPAQLGNAGLVAIGMIAMAYIGFAVGWLIAGARLLAVEGLPVPATTLGALMVAAALGPLVWFGTVLALTRRSRTWLRFVWLIAGLVLFVPWPFLVTGALA